jgi:hypothetical protein
MFVLALNSNLNLQRFKTLYVADNYSAILSKLDRKFTEPGDPPELHRLPAHDCP